MQLLTPRQIRAFKKHRVGLWSSYFVLFLILLAGFAEWVANNRPIVMLHEGKVYVPIYQNLTNERLEIPSKFLQVDFRKLEQDFPDTKMLWPPIRFNPYETDISVQRFPSAPDRQHWMGTDNRGRDVAARLIYGLRNSLIFALMVWVLSYIVGIFVGSIQGFYGGRIDFIFQRLIEIFNSIPFLFLLIILASLVQPNVYWLVLMTTLFGWIGISYYIRAEFFKLRKLEFIEAASSLGVSTPRLFLRHLIPNSMTPVITLSPFTITSSIGILASLDFLGFGLPPPAASWGELLNQAKNYFDRAWWLAVYPSLALAITLMAINFVGEALRAALDPRAGD